MFAQIIPGEVHVWCVIMDDLQAQNPVLLSFLSEDERARAERYRFTQDRTAYVVVRGMLRLLLGRYLKQDGRSLSFDYSSFGKPYVRAPIAFNVAHTRQAGLLAFMLDEPVSGDSLGVDIESVRPEIVTDELAGQVLSPIELARFDTSREKSQLFFDIWTRKEAYVKARGTGLSTPLPSLTVLDQLMVGRYALYPLVVNVPAHAAALAVKGQANTIRLYSMSDAWPD
jgi:4'-phosphopantetheinyl transferase